MSKLIPVNMKRVIIMYKGVESSNIKLSKRFEFSSNIIAPTIPNATLKINP